MFRKCWHCDRDVRVREKIINMQVHEVYIVHWKFGERCPASLTRVEDGKL